MCKGFILTGNQGDPFIKVNPGTSVYNQRYDKYLL